jgi:hypothetical protein
VSSDTPSSSSNAKEDPQVAGWTRFLSAWVARYPKFWRRLGNLETGLLRDDLEDVSLAKPIYVGGLARSGSTLLLEILNRHPETTTHRYRDFPLLFTPYWWNKFLDSMPQPPEEAKERAHGDRLLVTSESPEAMEEVLWMAFFEGLHDETQKNLLTGADKNESFDAFYAEHIRKLLAVRGGSRYLSKGNYNSTRIEYLGELFPDSLFVIPVRDPVTHIESLMRQHEKFKQLHAKDHNLALHMQRVGHFEFGAMRRLVNMGDTELINEINQLWDAGQHARGWAKYWASIYGYIARTISTDKLEGRCLVIRYEDLCENPSQVIGDMANHCQLEGLEQHISDIVSDISLPTYYKSSLSSAEVDAIWEEAAQAAEQFGYFRQPRGET